VKCTHYNEHFTGDSQAVVVGVGAMPLSVCCAMCKLASESYQT
jgi:hypothetical protein